MRVGVVGLGDIAQKAWLPVLLAHDSVEPVLITRDERRLTELLSRHRVREGHRSVEQALERGLDAAFVHTATVAHREVVAALLRAAGPDADTPRETSQAAPSRRRFTLDWLVKPAFALPAAILLLAIGVLAGLAGGGGPDSDPEMKSVRAEVNEQVAPNAEVHLQVAPGTATLVAENLPDPPRGRVYQVWVKRPDLDPEPTSTLFMPRADGSAAAAVPGSLEGIDAVLVSHEPPGGSPKPTSQPILQVAPPT